MACKYWPRDDRYYLDEDNCLVGPRGKLYGYLRKRHGYREVTPGGKTHYYHRVVMECCLGRALKSSEIVDHINRDRDDNRPGNLRIVTHEMSTYNKDVLAKGWSVANHGGGKRYQARITKDGKCMSLGLYATPEEAHDAYIKARLLLHPGAEEMEEGRE